MKRKPHNYTAGQLGFIEVMCKRLTDVELTAQLNSLFGISLSVEQIKGVRQRFGWKTGRTGRFEKGSVSWNKGKKYDAGGRSSQTRFKKGNRPQNYAPVGSESVKKKEDDLIYVKIAEPNKWQSKHSLLWEQHHGRKVPRGHVVTFADGDRRNFDISNLWLISRAELCLFNQRDYSTAPAEVRPTLLLATRLDAATHRAEKQ